VPGSYLWLLDPSSEKRRSSSTETTGPGDENSDSEKDRDSKHSLLRAAESAGVQSRRILFARRVEKAAHILRHAAADLFLDTLVYGAHSTATDAIRGVSASAGLCSSV
jgi:predicted O-linked N-acetylglucosamine transferase (SPINDLY family)